MRWRTERLRRSRGSGCSLVSSGSKVSSTGGRVLFLLRIAGRFCPPVFSKTAFIAQYQGVKEAASRVHDDPIGVGTVYHLFRLPEHIEQALFAGLHDKEFVDAVSVQVQDKERALASLASLADASTEDGEGPVLVGKIDALLAGKTLGVLAHHYQTAFVRGTVAYPYYLGNK